MTSTKGSADHNEKSNGITGTPEITPERAKAAADPADGISEPRPSPRLLWHPVHLISLGFGSGLSPVAPGTAGTLAAWLLYPLLHFLLPDTAVFLAVLLVFFAGGIFATHHTGKVLGVPDHGAIVWDEMVAMWLVLFFTPPGLIWQAIAVGLFRLFDILKPPPIRQADSRFKNGFGVMFDDLLAAAYALLALAALVYLHALLFVTGA